MLFTRVKENQINTAENLTHTMPVDYMPDTIVTIWLFQLRYTNTCIHNSWRYLR